MTVSRESEREGRRRHSVDRQRIDKWLWHARVVRRRSAAAGLADAGLVRINGVRVAAASATVRIGDVVTIALDRRVRVLKVGDIAARRSASASAEALYVELASMACDGQEPPSLAKAPSMG